MDKDIQIKKTKALWYLKNKKRLIQKSREYYYRKTKATEFKRTKKPIILTFD